MLKRTRVLAMSAVLISSLSPSFAQETTSDTVVASVNGTNITIGHMIVLRGSLPPQYQELPDGVLFSGLLDQLIQQTVLAQTLDGPTKGIELRVENERRTMMAGQAMNIAFADAVSEEALQAAYDERFAGAEPKKEFNASHILVETKEEADALVVLLEGGADFAETAKEKSTGPSGPNGGELGWFGAGMMVKSFEDAVLGMKAGDISAPIETQFGWHVIKLNEARTVAGPPLEEVRTELTDELRQVAIEAELTRLTDAADIERPDVSGIDPAILKQIELVDPQG